MKIFIKTAATDTKNTTDGYGSAKYNIQESLKALGHEVPETNDNIDVQLNFARPPLFVLKNEAYNIGYAPWESLELPKDWKKNADKCDEMWTTSDFCANIYDAAGIKNVKVFQHGIEKIWTPVKREKSEVLKFLHVGLPEGRKGGIEVLSSFIDIFGGNPNYHLTLKAYPGVTFDMNRIPPNVTIISKTITKEELVELHHQNDVMVYPSFGEGFGLIPLQALATGMPTISTSAWAPYRKYIGPLSLSSSPTPTRWEEKHPGTMLQPSLPHLGHLMTDVAYNFEEYSDYYYNQAEQILDEYDWVRLTEDAFKHIVK